MKPRCSCRCPQRQTLYRTAARAFTVIELVIVMAIIIILAGLILSISGYVQKKGARSRAEAEIAALSAALESYKADNAVYPSTANTNALDSRMMFDPTKYQAASFDLYAALTGDTNGNRSLDSSDSNPAARTYFSFKPNQLIPGPPSTSTVTSVRDPFGNSYGYSTAANPQANPTPTTPPVGNNPTFDLWSTANETDATRWIKNW